MPEEEVKDIETEFECVDCNKKYTIVWNKEKSLAIKAGTLGRQKAYPLLTNDQRSVMFDGLCLSCLAKCK